MARLYFEEIDDETENEETEDIEAAEDIRTGIFENPL